MLYTLPTEVNEALEKYLSCFDENGEVIWDYETAQKELEQLQNKQLEALEWCLTTRRNVELHSEAIDSEIERLLKIQESEKKRQDKLLSLIDRLVSPLYQDKPLAIGNFKVSYRKSESTVIDDQSKLPIEYLVYKPAPEPAPDKVKIKEAIKEWKEVTGARIETKLSLTVK